MFVEMWGFQLSLLNSISVIISGFSFCLRRGIPAFAVKLQRPYYLQRSLCLRRGIPAFAVKLHLCYHLWLFFLPAARYFRGPKVPKGLRFLGRELPKNQKHLPLLPISGISFPSLLRIQHGRSSSLTPPRVRLRSSNSLLYSACAVLSENPSGGNQAAAIKIKR